MKKPPRWITLEKARGRLSTEDEIVEEWISTFCDEAAKLIPALVKNKMEHTPLFELPDLDIQLIFRKRTQIAIEELLNHTPRYRDLIISGEVAPAETAQLLAPQIADSIVKG